MSKHTPVPVTDELSSVDNLITADQKNPEHVHTCHICHTSYPCTELTVCATLDPEHAVCGDNACIMEWDSYDDEPAFEERHPTACTCEDCRCADYDPHREAYPAR